MYKYYLTLIILYSLIPSNKLLAQECRRYLILYPVNYNFNNSVEILENWKKDNIGLLKGCDRFISTSDNNSTLLEVNIDFFNYKSFEIINKSQADYIQEHSNATHLVKIAQTIVAGDLALMPVVFNLKTLEVDTAPPFHKVTVLKEGALSLLNYGSMNNILSNIMRLMLPNSLAIGPGLNYLRNHRILADEIDVEIIDGNTQLWPSILIDLNKIHPPFAYDKEGAFNVNLASSFKFSRTSEVYEFKDSANDSDINEYELGLYKININFFTELSYSSFIGTFYTNLGFGWNLIYVSDNLGRSEFDDVISLNANLGYRYFFNKDVFLELDVGYSQYVPNLVDTPYIYVNNEISAMVGLGLFVPGIYQGFFKLIR